jgi:putative drug exporter of the RND superfamily
MSNLLARVGSFSSRRRWLVLGIWIGLLMVALAGAKVFAQPFDPTIKVPGVESINTLDRINKQFKAGSGSDSGEIVFAAPARHRLTKANAATIAGLAKTISHIPGVRSAPDPFRGPGTTIASSGRIGFIPVALTHKTSTKIERAIGHAIDGARTPSLQIEATSGLTVDRASSLNPLPGILIGFVVLLLTFGSLAAAGLPLTSALVGLAISIGGIYAATSVIKLNSDAPDLAILLGLAVGIDYSLFIVSRHRQQLLAGREIGESISSAVSTAGSAVVFAALTVVIALGGLAVEGVGVLTQMGVAAAAAVFIAMLLSITLTPALLSLAGRRVLTRRSRKRIATGQFQEAHQGKQRWIRAISARPIIFIVAAVAVLGILAMPVGSLRLGLPSSASQPSSMTERRAADLIAEGWGPGYNGPIVVLAEYASRPDAVGVTDTRKALATVRDVKSVTPSGASGDDVLFTVIPKTGPADKGTESLVQALRGHIVGVPRLLVSGQTAVNIDISQYFLNKLPLYLGLIVVFAFLLLLIAFRSILIPLKAVIGFALSLAATMGCVVAVFQWGWLGNIVGVDPAGPLLSYLPTIVVGVLFGLSMDYEMFLLSGMREARDQGADAPTTVTRGFSTGARVVVIAALIMICIFGNGAITGSSGIKAIAFALAMGVLLDGFVVRMTLVPAVMFLLGRAAWWLPNWLQRITPRLNLEGSSLPSELDAQRQPEN